MAYTEEVLARARTRLARQRELYMQEQAAWERQTYAKYPRLQEIDNRLRTTVAEAMNAAFRRGTDPAAAIESLKAENLALQRERDEILKQAGLSSDSVNFSPPCPVCGGTGYQGAVMCSCLKELCRMEQETELAELFDAGVADFSAFSLQYYSSRLDPAYGISPRENMQFVLDEAHTYAENFSRPADSLLFYGETGLGKTSLSACIARTVSDKGYSVVYDTAVHLFSEFETEKFKTSRDEESRNTRKYFQCDLLIVDDLGTELSTQFTVSVLYNMVNTRLMNRQGTIVSTNLSMEEMHRRYTPQIVSRLEGDYRTLTFMGSDIRLLRRNES